MINKGLINIKNSSSSIIKAKAGIFNPDASYSTRRNSKSGIWSLQDVYEQQKSKTWTLKDKKAKVKTQILASSPIYNSVSAEKCASTVKLFEDVFCLVYASSDTVINYELFSVEIGLSLTDKSGLITSEELGSITTLTEGAARVSEISSSFDETSNRILLCITYGYGTGGGISGGSQVMTSKSAVKIVIGKYNNALRSVSWTVVNNLYDLTISSTPYNTDPVPSSTPIQTPISTLYDTPIITSYQTLNTPTTVQTLVQTPIFSGTRLTEGTTTIQTPIFSGTRLTQSLTIIQTPIFSGIRGTLYLTVISTAAQTPFPTSLSTPVTTLQATPKQTVVSGRVRLTAGQTPVTTFYATPVTTLLATAPSTFIYTIYNTQNDTLLDTTIQTLNVTTQNDTLLDTTTLTQNVTTQNDTLFETAPLTSIITQGLTPVGTIGQTPVSTLLATSLATLIPGDPVVNNAPPSQIYSVCETERIGENTFIISTHGYVRVISLTSDTTYSAGTQTASSIVPAGGSTELLKTAWDSISSEYVELAWDIVNSLGKISRYTVSGTTVTAQDTTTLTSTQMSSSIGNIINIGARKYIWNDYEELYQVTHNGTSFSISASPLNLGTIGTSNFNTTLIKDNNVPGFVMGYFSNETTSTYNKIVNYLYDNSITGGTESNSFSLLGAEFSNNTAINYVDLVTFEDNVVLLIYEYSSILYANILQLKSY